MDLKSLCERKLPMLDAILAADVSAPVMAVSAVRADANGPSGTDCLLLARKTGPTFLVMR